MHLNNNQLLKFIIMKLRYCILFMVFFCISCGKNSSSKIKGQWYHIDRSSKDFMEALWYNEISISDSTFLYCSEIIGLYGPRKYKLKQDTIIFFDKQQNIDKEYMPVYHIINDTTMLLSYKTQIDTLRRISNEYFFVDSLLNKGNYERFLNQFYRRKLKFTNYKSYLKHQKDQDTVFYHEIEEEIILPHIDRNNKVDSLKGK